MKIKFKEFVKKIKNWLSSLSKWAQKHIIKILFVFSSCILLLSMCLRCSSNVACADNTPIATYNTYFVPTTNFKLSNGEGTVSYSVRMPCFNINLLMSNDNYTFDSVTMLDGYSNVNNSGYVDDILNVRTISFRDLEYNSNYNYYIMRTRISFYMQQSSDIIVYGESRQAFFVYRQYVSDFHNLMPSRVTIDKDIINTLDGICYTFSAVSGSNTFVPLFSITFLDLYYGSSHDISFVDSGTYNLLPTYTILTDNVSYRSGYDTGYYYGYEEGLLYNTTNKTPLGIIASNVNSLLDINLFGNFSLGDLISISFGVVLLGLVIKIFLGG